MAYVCTSYFWWLWVHVHNPIHPILLRVSLTLSQVLEYKNNQSSQLSIQYCNESGWHEIKYWNTEIIVVANCPPNITIVSTCIRLTQKLILKYRYFSCTLIVCYLWGNLCLVLSLLVIWTLLINGIDPTHPLNKDNLCTDPCIEFLLLW